MAPFIALYDACCLYPVSLRDLLVSLGQTKLFQAKWTARILDEFINGLLRNHPGRPELAVSLAKQRRQMNDAIRDVEVKGWEQYLPLVPALPDPGDAHVVAAAIRSRAQVIVTFNLKHFPAAVLAAHDIEAQHPDEFVRHLVDLDRDTVERVIRVMAATKKNPPMSFDDVLDMLAKRGLGDTAAALRHSR